MEQHPIPQDVTGFQFKLIGTMTVKQFGYVAVGAIFAVICWYAPVKEWYWHVLAKGLLLPVFAVSGIIIAFVPIEGRPVDVMAANFFHALVSPSQYIYIKKGRKFSFTQTAYSAPAPVTTVVQKPVIQTSAENKKEQQLRSLLSSSYKDSRSNIDKKEMAFLQSFNAMPAAAVQPVKQTTQPPAPKPALLFPATAQSSQVQSPARQVAPPQQTTTTNEQQKTNADINTSHLEVLELQKETQDIHAQKMQVEQELLRLKNQLSVQKSTVAPATQQQPEKQQPVQDLAHVRNIPQNMTTSAGLSHVPDTPNVVVGIIKDSRGNILPNILVEVKDKDGNPVRAFKSNPLGQFASATPLSNGIYTIELEDPKKLHTFDLIQINASGQIMMPIEIISHDAREELRQALFN